MIIYLNFGELDSWLTLKPLRGLLTEISFDVEVRPMLGSVGNVVGQSAPGDPDPLRVYKERRAEARRQASFRELERQCEMLDLSIEQAERRVNPLMMSLGLLWVSRQAGNWLDFCHSAFEQTYRENADVETINGAVRLILAAGVSAAGFSDFVANEQTKLADSANELIAQGILSAPAFVLEEQIFLGREHLPFIGWILGGRSGEPPV